MRSKRVILAAGAVLAAFALLVPSAVAEPSGAPPFRALAGGGSVTTQEVLNALSDVVTIGSPGVKQIGSYNATGSPTIQTKATGCSGIPRPSGSGAGVGALQDSLEGVAFPGCLDFARSSVDNSASFPSNPPTDGAPGRLSYVPFAQDGVDYVIRDDSPLPLNLATTDLKDIYNCLSPASDVLPLLPQASSGTRRVFLLHIGFTQAEIDNFTSTTHPCVNFGQAPIENVGTTLTSPLNIAPYSIGDYIAQINRRVADVHGRTILGDVDGHLPIQINTSWLWLRLLFNVIPTPREALAPTSTVFVGPNSLVCQQPTVIQGQGFLPLPTPTCGVISIRTVN